MSSLSSNAVVAHHSEVSARDDSDPVYYGIALTSWVKIGVITLLMGMLFWPNLRRLWDKTNPFYGEPNWGHAILIPFIGLYYLYVNRETLFAARAQTAWSGLGILFGGILFFVYAIWPGQNDFFKDVGMVVALFGVVTLLCGWEVMKTAWFPIVFLFCALPWPGLMYSTIAGPLQHLAAQVAVRVLTLTGVEAGCSGTKIIMATGTGVRTLNVAEACAGLRSLMTFVSVAAAIAFLTSRPLWQRLVLVMSAVPIAVFCNVMRVAGQGLLDHYVSTSLSEGFAHQFVGLIMLIPAFFLILLVAWLMDHLFVDDVTDKSKLRPRVATVRGPVVAMVSKAPAAKVQAPAHPTGAPIRAVTPPPPVRARPQTMPPRPTGLTGATQKPARPRAPGPGSKATEDQS